jgi:hypothetical protein
MGQRRAGPRADGAEACRADGAEVAEACRADGAEECRADGTGADAYAKFTQSLRKVYAFLPMSVNLGQAKMFTQVYAWFTQVYAWFTANFTHGLRRVYA